MVNPARADALVDLAYGGLIAVSIVLIATVNTNVGVAFGVGVFAAYVVHVVWKMARFDPDWMTRTVRETVEETMEETVEDTVEETVEATMEESVEESVEQTVEDTVEESVGESMAETVERAVGEQLDEVQAQVESLDERVDREGQPEEVGDANEEPEDSRA
ncbi:hypothetical protein I7X12_04585 [Halosimplex litoreum]|uniref:Glutamate/valine-rich protein n=1 Tax=Halosimplex litoreum TaxID=1198301 RepID=A0A7T3KWC7_9EURY|nr:hypothetical protein [Halosimplex litoreum]QPV63913.1 hypothetical protein I7X12_04585 [Halosimplex litoreum]